MQVIKNHVTVRVSQEKAVLIHTLTGGMYVLSPEEYQIFCNWKNASAVIPCTPIESDLYKLLLDHRFLVESEAQEKQLENEILEHCKTQYRQMKTTTGLIAFVLTYRCNFKCPYCYEGNGKSDNEIQSHNIMSAEMVDAIFSIHHNCIENILFYGGEPLLPCNEKIIHYIISKAPFSNYSVITNGYYLEEYFDILSTLNNIHIMVTLDGEEVIHNKTRILRSGGETFEKIMRGIDLFLTHNIHIKIRMNISNSNIQSCLSIKDQLIEQYKEQYDQGTLQFEMQPIFQTEGNERMMLEQALYFPRDKEGSEDKQPRLRHRENTITRTLSPLVSVFSNPTKFVPRYCNCGAEMNSRFYDVDGNIYSCILAVGKKNAAIGQYYPSLNMKSTGMHCRNIEAIPECRECKFHFLCGGGCANSIMDEEGNVMYPNCELIMHEINSVLPALYNRYIK